MRELIRPNRELVAQITPPDQQRSTKRASHVALFPVKTATDGAIVESSDGQTARNVWREWSRCNGSVA